MSFPMFHFSFSALKHHPTTLVAFALLTETLILACVSFLFLFSLEMLLPTLVSTHLNLALYFGGILFLFIMHHAISLWLQQKIHPPTRVMRQTMTLLLFLWALALIGLSLLKFPLWAAIVICGIIFYCGYLFKQIHWSL